MSKSNLEFRKIKSLKYLYEISLDGRHIRNVKSKKGVEIVPRIIGADKIYFARIPNGDIGDYKWIPIDSLLHEVTSYKPTWYVLKGEDDYEEWFKKKKEVVNAIVDKTGIPRKRVKDRIKEGRHHIGQFNIEYIF